MSTSGRIVSCAVGWPNEALVVVGVTAAIPRDKQTDAISDHYPVITTLRLDEIDRSK